MSGKIVRRKAEHLEIAQDPLSQSSRSQLWEQLRFEPNALPELNLSQIDSSERFLDRRISCPLLISSMSGGIEHADKMNIHLAEAAAETNVALALGSMRITLEDQSGEASFKVGRYLTGQPLIANIGAAQIIGARGLDNALRCVELSEASGLFVHLNPLQEALQPEGDTNWVGISDAIEALVARSPVPVLIKEVGHGIGLSTARRLVQLGVKWIDVAGCGGTSWAQIEHSRHAEGASIFADWGIDTVTSLKSITAANLPVSLIASGGLRNGLELAKAIRLGGVLGGMAQPFLAPALESTAAVVKKINEIKDELRIVQFCTGSGDIASLRSAPWQC
jgi:isopentenyl-diphosphate delta-isomerase